MDTRYLQTWPAPPMPVLKGFLCLTHVSSWMDGSCRFCCCWWCECCGVSCCCWWAERLVSLAPSSDKRSTSAPLLLPPSAVDGVVRRSAIGGACWMPCECSIKRSASSSSSLERSLDKRGPATGDGASVDAELDMVGDGRDGRTGCATRPLGQRDVSERIAPRQMCSESAQLATAYPRRLSS
jgi:hypothetical protein